MRRPDRQARRRTVEPQRIAAQRGQGGQKCAPFRDHGPAGRKGSIQHFPMDTYPAFIWTFGVKTPCLGSSIIELRSILQCIDHRVNRIPKLMAKRGAQIPNDERIPLFAISAATRTICNGYLNSFHSCLHRVSCVLPSMEEDTPANIVFLPKGGYSNKPCCGRRRLIDRRRCLSG